MRRTSTVLFSRRLGFKEQSLVLAYLMFIELVKVTFPKTFVHTDGLRAEGGLSSGLL